MARKTKNPRPKAALKLVNIQGIDGFRTRLGGISLNFANNSTVFTTPVPTVIVVNGHLVDLQDAQNLVETRVLGATTTRDLKYEICLKDACDWQGYVQTLADALPYTEAINLITLSGFDIKVNGVYEKPPMAVKATILPTTVKLIAKAAGKNAAYSWQMSINNGTTWTDLPITNVAKTTVSGLNSGTRYLFRFRSTVKNVASIWSVSVSIVIQFPAV